MSESPAYLTGQLIAYRGGKRKLLGLLAEALGLVTKRLGCRKLSIFDGFSGTGVCSRFFKQYASLLIANDLQPYAAALARCFLANRSDIDFARLETAVADLEIRKFDECSGFIQRLYAPADDTNIKLGERAYFTCRNAQILDGTCLRLASVDEQLRPLILGPLLAEASLRSNTAGHFKGFIKDKNTGIGRFGGAADARVGRMTPTIALRLPVLSNYECEHRVYSKDVNEVAASLEEIDVAYFDPPYDTESYGALYWMLNLLVNYEEPERVSKITGVPHNWIRSDYTRKNGVEELLTALIEKTPARFILLSYSNEGKISPERVEAMLGRSGTFSFLEQRHRRFNSSHQSTKHGTRGTRYARPPVVERLYVLEKR